MVHAIRIHEHGGADTLRWEEVTLAEPGPGEVRIKHRACGVNFIDTYQRSGLYKLPLPLTLGMEGAGDVTKVGPGVVDIKVGDRVAYSNPIGGYTEERNIPADRLCIVPAAIDYKTAAAMMLQGQTVRYLIKETYKVGPGTTLLWHAAAGGVGLIACQWAKHLGATIIGTAGSAEKCALAKAHGADYVIDYTKEDVAKRVREITNGAGVDVVYDSVGKDTFAGSLDSLKPKGLFVTFGNASGPVTGVDMGIFAAKGSLYATRPTLFTYTATKDANRVNAADLFDVVGKGIVKINVNHTYPLKDAAQAHRDLEGRKTTGSIVLIP